MSDREALASPPMALRRDWHWRTPPAPLTLALGVALAYYVGVQVGLALRFPPATTSVLWPPNSLLTTALLITPVRRWPIALFAALPVHVLLQSAVGWPLALVLSLFVTNCAEALIAATIIRRFSDQPTGFDTIRSVSVFCLGAGLLAPVLSSFADAAVVRLFQGEAYWTVWQTRVFANSLTALSVVPLAVAIARSSPASLLGALRARRLEVAMFFVALTGVAGLVFWAGPLGLALPGVPRTPTVFLLPILFWAAVRFGAAGSSGALLLLALSASVAARAGSRPFEVLAPAESLSALQIYLILMSVPLFVVAASLAERGKALGELRSRLGFEALVSSVSGACVRYPSDRFGETIEDCARLIGEWLAVDRALIVQRAATGPSLTTAGQWTAEAVPRLSDSSSCSTFPWVVNRVLAGREVVCHSIDALPPEAAEDRRAFAALRLRSALVVPLATSGTAIGALSLHAVRAPRAWDAPTIERVRILAEVLASALDRHRSEEAVRQGESTKAAILESLSSHVTVLDRQGTIIAANERWHEEVRRRGLGRDDADVGANFFTLAPAFGLGGSLAAVIQSATRAIQAVGDEPLERTAGQLEYEYTSTDSRSRWFAVTVVPLRRPAGGAVVTQRDISDRKRAEIEAQQARHELTHLSRVSTMGELTASLAHQLNQPLAGILSNAEAASRLLAARTPDVDEARAAITDIIDDDLRARDVIRRMRELLTKTPVAPQLIDLNDVVRDITTVTISDAIIRHVETRVELCGRPLRVLGNRVELQQVVLNILVNAIEAVTEQPPGARRVVVRTGLEPETTATITIADSGRGFDPRLENSLFEPFVTTKPSGMGMGLAIARSLVESHGGRISTESGAGSGASFVVWLPLAADGHA